MPPGPAGPVAMDHDPVSSKRGLSPDPPMDGPGKTPRTLPAQAPLPAPPATASFLLRAYDGARVFSNPSKVSQALHLSTLGKYILEGETRSLGIGSALIVALW